MFMKNYNVYNTFGQQINSNAEDYCLDYQQYAIKHYSEHSSKNCSEVNPDVQQKADEVRGNKPATMAEISALNKKIGGPKLKITTDQNYKPTEEDIAQGVKVIYIQPGEKDENGVEQVGHAYFVNDKGDRVYIHSNPNDCLYMVYSKILEEQGIMMTVQQLREVTASAIDSNADFIKVLEAEKWIHERHPKEANTLLFCAGIIKNEKNEWEVEDADLDDLDNAIKNNSENGAKKKELKVSLLYVKYSLLYVKVSYCMLKIA